MRDEISIARDLLSGFTIALISHSLDPSLSTQLIAPYLFGRLIPLVVIVINPKLAPHETVIANGE